MILKHDWAAEEPGSFEMWRCPWMETLFKSVSVQLMDGVRETHTVEVLFQMLEAAVKPPLPPPPHQTQTPPPAAPPLWGGLDVHLVPEQALIWSICCVRTHMTQAASAAAAATAAAAVVMGTGHSWERTALPRIPSGPGLRPACLMEAEVAF